MTTFAPDPHTFTKCHTSPYNSLLHRTNTLDDTVRLACIFHFVPFFRALVALWVLPGRRSLDIASRAYKLPSFTVPRPIYRRSVRPTFNIHRWVVVALYSIQFAVQPNERSAPPRRRRAAQSNASHCKRIERAIEIERE